MTSLTDFVAEELDRPVPDAARAVADDILARHGDAVAAILFYGSVLRDQGSAGILDLYVLTDDLHGYHETWLAALANSLLPPNVEYREVAAAAGLVRAKVAVIACRSFRRRAGGQGLDTTIWARFCQPALLVYAKDDPTREAVVEAIADCHRTALRWARRFSPGSVTPAIMWTRLFERTYAAELRAERSSRAAAIYEASSERYVRLAELGKAAASGMHLPWSIYRICGKTLNVLRLAKAAFTFRNGLDYLVWKIQRHAGRPLIVSPWERRHPFLAAPGFLWRLYRDGFIR